MGEFDIPGGSDLWPSAVGLDTGSLNFGGFDFRIPDLPSLPQYNPSQPSPYPAIPPGVPGSSSTLGDIATGIGKGFDTLGGIARTALPIGQLGLGVLGAVEGAQAAGRLNKQTAIAERAGQTQQDVAQKAIATA